MPEEHWEFNPRIAGMLDGEADRSWYDLCSADEQRAWQDWALQKWDDYNRQHYAQARLDFLNAYAEQLGQTWS